MMNLLVQWLVEGAALAAAATVVVRLIPSGSAAQRHGFWWVVLAGVLASPWVPSHIGRSAVATAASDASASTAQLFFVPAPPSWVFPTLVAIWSLAALASLLRLGFNLRLVREIARDAARFDHPIVDRLVSERGFTRPVDVRVTSRIRGACAVGYVRPRILLSNALVSALDDGAIEAIVLHEHAHLQRYDDWSRVLQQMVLAVAGLHPAVRWVSRQIDIEREAACDRLVVERTGAAMSYARSLVAAADVMSRSTGPTPFIAPGASIASGGLQARVSRLLEARSASRTVARLASIAGTASFTAVGAIVVGLPPLVAIASLEPQSRALASRSFTAAAPTLQGSTPDRLRREAVVGSPARRGAVPARQVPSPARASDHDMAAAPTFDDRPTAMPELGVLPSTAIPVESLRGLPVSPPVPGRSNGGSAATRAASAAADAAARAGSAMGRFFGNGGRAIARAF